MHVLQLSKLCCWPLLCQELCMCQQCVHDRGIMYNRSNTCNVIVLMMWYRVFSVLHQHLVLIYKICIYTTCCTRAREISKRCVFKLEALHVVSSVKGILSARLKLVGSFKKGHVIVVIWSTLKSCLLLAGLCFSARMWNDFWQLS